MSHIYRAIDTTNHMQFESTYLPDITKEVRKYVKLRHGNLIRSALLEEGAYHARGMGRSNKISNIYYDFEITIERYEV